MALWQITNSDRFIFDAEFLRIAGLPSPTVPTTVESPAVRFFIFGG